MNDEQKAVILEIIGRAIERRGIEGLAAWLIAPRGSDGITTAEHLAAGHYDRARMLAVCETSQESARRAASQGAMSEEQDPAKVTIR